MCQVQMLRALVNQRLTAAVEEIFVVLERTIAEYEEELSRTKEENERQRQLLDAVFRKQEVVLHRADASEDVPIEPQPPHIKEEKEDPQPPHIKEEKEEPQPPHIKEEEGGPSIGQEEERRGWLQDADAAKPPAVSVRGEREGDEGRGQRVEKKEAELPGGSSSRRTGTEADSGGSDSDDTTSQSSDADDEDCGVACSGQKKPFRCFQCGKHFDKKFNLTSHMKRHTPDRHFPCSQCGKKFVVNNDLKVHMRIHTGEKPYSCTVCGNRFSQKGTLTTHMRRHTGEKPFLCLFCGRRFPRRYTLMKHMLLHTG
uniref:zinc finger protein with KRAB and SCAN domains 1-like n=1 Tax=Doryrhamphus excisus TaxID=161450 RepID=UPI0025ADD17C|nr:zinc finger protein with KRAB and SCAN domains 1-like [Doryrhamphus excisus]